MGARTAAFGAGVEGDSADIREEVADPFEHFRLRAFCVALDEIDVGDGVLPAERGDGLSALPDARRVGDENGGIGALGRKSKIDLAIFFPDDDVMRENLFKPRNILLQAGVGSRVRFEAMNPRPVAGADMRELADIGPDVKNDAAGSERHMAADPVFAFEAVEPRRPAVTVKLPPPRRRHGDIAPVDAHRQILAAPEEIDPNIAADPEPRIKTLAQEFQADLKRQLHVSLGNWPRPAIVETPPVVIPRASKESQMTQIRELQVRKDDLSTTRLVARAAPALADGEVLAKVDRFALTANNITYGVVGEKIGYWRFFPEEEGWGIIPVWGFANVVETRHPEVKNGERLYGYFPMGTHLVMRPDKVRPERLTDAAPHRAGLPPVYNSYARTAAEPHFDKAMEDERALLFPLYATSFCICDFLKDNAWFGAAQVIVPSASSKTAIGLAYALNADGEAPATIGLTSERNSGRVKALSLYGAVATYDRLDDVDVSKATVIADMSGDGGLLSELHRRLGDNMRYTANVGVTHYDANRMGPDFIRERSAMFFAPGHIQKRAADWGSGVFEKKAFAFWKEAAEKSRDWLRIELVAGVEGLTDAYAQVLEGRSAPDKGIIVAL